MERISVNVPDICLLRAPRYEDARGYLEEMFHSSTFSRLGLPEFFAQDFLSFSARAGTLRGMHFQKPPHAQGKLLRVLAGRVRDVAVDLRHGSPHFGTVARIELSAAQPEILYIPPGFAHGYVTLEDSTLLSYKVTDHYHPECAGGVSPFDPALNIAWDWPRANMIVNERDAELPLLSELPAVFSLPS